MTISECVQVFMQKLRSEGILDGNEVYPKGLPLPDGGEVVDLHVFPSEVGKYLGSMLGKPGLLSYRLSIHLSTA